MASIPTIMKGDTSGMIPVTVPEALAKLTVAVAGVTHTFLDVSANSTVLLSYTAEETAEMPLGTHPIAFAGLKSGGDVKTYPITAKLKVTDCPGEVYSAPVTIDGGEVVRTQPVGEVGEGATMDDIRTTVNRLARIASGAATLLVALAACALGALALYGVRVVRMVRRALSPREMVAFAALAAVCARAAQKRGTVTFPRTDPTMAYLVDRGSYTTNDFVHVDFTRVIVPDTASWYLDRRELAQTNDADWATFSTGLFGEWNPPRDFPCANATNYNWLFYTDWTPGPSVVTNGVWHAFWGRDRRVRRFYIPLRTCVREDGSVIATPKSKEDNR